MNKKSSNPQVSKRWNWRLIEKSLKDGGDVNASMVSTGPQAGYSALHFAVMENEEDLVSKLITEYKANVNCIGEDGAQPIHLAAFRNYHSFAEILVQSGANIDAEITKNLVERYAEDQKWSDDFGEKMTLLTLAIINNNWSLLQISMNNNANVGVKNRNNKTLLMYALENDFEHAVLRLTYCMKDNQELINARDNNGLHAVHYLLPDKIFGEFRYDGRRYVDDTQGKFAEQIIEAGTDIKAMVNDDPDTLLINKAAFRCCLSMLKVLLDLDIPITSEAKPLNYFMLPIDSEKYILVSEDIEDIEERRNKCLEHILKNLVLRSEIGMFVLEDEKKLMNQLIATDLQVQMIVKNFQKDFIDNLLKKEEISYDDKTITYYDLAVRVFDSKSLKLLVRDDKFIERYQEFYEYEIMEDKFMLQKVMHDEITSACERRKVMEKVEKIHYLRKFIPLPYEIILMIIEYVDNKSLEKFVEAFYKDSIC